MVVAMTCLLPERKPETLSPPRLHLEGMRSRAVIFLPLKEVGGVVILCLCQEGSLRAIRICLHLEGMYRIRIYPPSEGVVFGAQICLPQEGGRPRIRIYLPLEGVMFGAQIFLPQEGRRPRICLHHLQGMCQVRICLPLEGRLRVMRIFLRLEGMCTAEILLILKREHGAQICLHQEGLRVVVCLHLEAKHRIRIHHPHLRESCM